MLDQHATRVRDIFAPTGELGVGLWLSAQTARGADLALGRCTACHGVDGRSEQQDIPSLAGQPAGSLCRPAHRQLTGPQRLGGAGRIELLP